jgi:lysophospholipase L1-like esterase
VFLGACVAAMSLGVVVAESADSDLRMLALGDSYTIGEGVDAAGRWPDQLVAALRNTGLRLAAPEIIARTGWTTDELAAAVDAHAFRPPYDLVTLLIGVNNQYRAGQEPKYPESQGSPRGTGRDLDNYRSEFRTLLQRAIALAGARPAHVVVVSIPDWGVTKFGRASGRDIAQIARELDAYNAANAAIAAELRVRYADVTPASRAGGAHADMLAADGLHPSAAMYRRWLDAILPTARQALAE